MSAAGWEALCARAASHVNLGPDAEDDDPRSAEHIDGCNDPGCCWPIPDQAAGLALFARLMSLIEAAGCKCGEAKAIEQPICKECSLRWLDDLKTDSSRQPAAQEPSDAVLMLRCGGDEGWTQIKSALRRFHDGTDRGELMALLVEAWGARPVDAQVNRSRRASSLASPNVRAKIRAGGIYEP